MYTIIAVGAFIVNGLAVGIAAPESFGEFGSKYSCERTLKQIEKNDPDSFYDEGVLFLIDDQEVVTMTCIEVNPGKY